MNVTPIIVLVTDDTLARLQTMLASDPPPAPPPPEQAVMNEHGWTVDMLVGGLLLEAGLDQVWPR